MMLKSIDVLIGLSVVMLVGSFAVTLLTQILTSLANTRGRHLYRGLVDILQHIDPSFERKIAQEISRNVLQNPMLSEVSRRFASVVSREELTTLLLDFAAGTNIRKLTDPALAALRKALEKNGITNPDKTLSNIRDLAFRLEKSNPELANNVRVNTAILHEASSTFVAKINSWFDQTIDRVRLRFASTTHVITLVLALIIAVAVQMDAVGIVNRLYADPALRQSLVEKGKALDANAPAAGSSTGTANAASSGGVVSPASVPPQLNERVLADADVLLGQSGILSASAWQWTWLGGFLPLPVWTSFSFQKLLGVLLSAALLSLGAPFWYDCLKNTLKFRSALAQTDDAQRSERQTTQPLAASDDDSTQSSPAAPKLTEAGDLTAIG